MEKIKLAFKNFFSAIGGYIVLGITAVAGILLYALVRKNEQLEATKATLALAKTQKDVDLIETEIKQRQDNRNATAKELQGVQKELDLLAEKRKTISDNKTDQEVEDYWNKK